MFGELSEILNAIVIILRHLLRPRRLIRVVAYHLLGQPGNRVPDRALSKFFNKLFLANKLLPRLGGYIWFGQGEIDRLIVDTLEKVRGPDKSGKGFFVEVGSNDGTAFSNCKHLELFEAYQGVLIEPYLPNLELSKLHRKGPHFVHGAVVPSSFSMAEVELEFSNLMTRMTLGDSDRVESREFADSGKDFLFADQERHSFVAPALRLEQILDSVRAPKEMDLLSLDIEGFELEILRDFNFEKYSFKLIVVESFDPKPMIDLMKVNGYELLLRHSSFNLLFLRASTK